MAGASTPQEEHFLLAAAGCRLHANAEASGGAVPGPGVPADTLPALELYKDVGGRPLADCPGCGQAGTVTRGGSDGLVLFDSFAKCGYGSGIYRDAATNGGAAEKAISTLTDFAPIVARPVEWLWRHRIALAKLTALAGPRPSPQPRWLEIGGVAA